MRLQGAGGAQVLIALIGGVVGGIVSHQFLDKAFEREQPVAKVDLEAARESRLAAARSVAAYNDARRALMQEDAESARQRLREAVLLDPGNDRAATALAMLEETPARRKAARAVSPQDSQQAYLEGVIYFQKGDFEKARGRWLEAKELDPGNSDAVAGLEKIEKLYGMAP